MAVSPLKTFLLSAILLPGTVFFLSTAPVAILGSQEIVLEIQDETVFTGQLREMAPPYLALATTVSAVVGVAAVALTGWQQSKSQLAQLESQLSQQQQVLKTTEEKLEELKLSASLLEASGLGEFVEKVMPEKPTLSVVKDNLSQSHRDPEVENLQPNVSDRSASTVMAERERIDNLEAQLEALRNALSMVSGSISAEPKVSDFQSLRKKKVAS